MLRIDWTASWWVGLIIITLWLMLGAAIVSMLWLGAHAQNVPRAPKRTRTRRRQLMRDDEHMRVARQHAWLPPFMRGARPRSVHEGHHARSHAR